jgi:hypothetical protein
MFYKIPTTKQLAWAAMIEISIILGLGILIKFTLIGIQGGLFAFLVTTCLLGYFTLWQKPNQMEAVEKKFYYDPEVYIPRKLVDYTAHLEKHLPKKKPTLDDIQ